MAQESRSNQERGRMSREEAGRKGGEKVSRNREHMADIGRKGGEKVSRNREHMADIGRKGGEASHGGRSSRQRDDTDARRGGDRKSGSR